MNLSTYSILLFQVDSELRTSFLSILNFKIKYTVPDVVGIDVSNPPVIPLKLDLSFIRSIIFSSAAVEGLSGGPPPVFLACLRA